MTTDTIRHGPPMRLSTSAPADQHELILAKIRRDGGTQARAGNNETVLEEYTAAMREERWTWHAGNRLIVFFDGTDYWLGDGFHRAESASRAGLLSVPCEVRQGNRREAVLFACGANDSHGLRRTRDDVRRAIVILLRDEEWGQWSNAEISRRVGCSDKTVGAVRGDLESASEIPRLETRKGSDGKTYTVPAPAVSAAPIYDDSPLTDYDDSPLTDEELHDLSLLGGLELHGASTSSMGLPQITLMNARDDWGYKETRTPGGWRIELDQMRGIEELKIQARAEIAKKEAKKATTDTPPASTLTTPLSSPAQHMRSRCAECGTDLFLNRYGSQFLCEPCMTSLGLLFNPSRMSLSDRVQRLGGTLDFVSPPPKSRELAEYVLRLPGLEEMRFPRSKHQPDRSLCDITDVIARLEMHGAVPVESGVLTQHAEATPPATPPATPLTTPAAAAKVERGALTHHAEATLAGLVEKLSGSELRLLYFLMMGECELLDDEAVSGGIWFEGKKMLGKTLFLELGWIVEGVKQNAGL